MVAEGSVFRRGACSEEMRIECEKERPLIDEIVSCIAHEADTVQEPAADKLGCDDYRINGEGELEP